MTNPIVLPTGQPIDAIALPGDTSVVYRQISVNGDPATLLNLQSVVGGGQAPNTGNGAAVSVIRPDQLGSTGLDHTANLPAAWPNVGAAFGGGNPLYPSWVLLGSVSANIVRVAIEIWDMSGEPILVLRDDGTAPGGQPPTNASGFTLHPIGAVAPCTWRSKTFKGRVQIYGLTSSDYVSIFED